MLWRGSVGRVARPHEEDMALQLDALAPAGCAQVFQDTASEANRD